MTLPVEVEKEVTTKYHYSVVIDANKIKEFVGAPYKSLVYIEDYHESGDELTGKIRIMWVETETKYEEPD